MVMELNERKQLYFLPFASGFFFRMSFNNFVVVVNFFTNSIKASTKKKKILEKKNRLNFFILHLSMIEWINWLSDWVPNSLCFACCLFAKWMLSYEFLLFFWLPMMTITMMMMMVRLTVDNSLKIIVPVDGKNESCKHIYNVCHSRNWSQL